MVVGKISFGWFGSTTAPDRPSWMASSGPTVEQTPMKILGINIGIHGAFAVVVNDRAAPPLVDARDVEVPEPRNA